MQVCKNLNNELVKNDMTTKHPGRNGTWSLDELKRSKASTNKENSETNVVIGASENPTTIEGTDECVQKRTQTDELKRDLTIKELDKLKERTMPLIPGKEIEWAVITQDITKTLTPTDEKAMLQLMRKNLTQHEEALAKVKILLVHTAQWPDQYPNPLENFMNGY